MPCEGPCPCGSASDYADCCGPLHRGDRVAATALALMRSRYSAFALGHADYLLNSWHPTTRPKRLDLDRDIRWRRLQIVDTDDGVVEFRAQYELDGKRHILHERSRFVCTKGRWFYVDGDIEP